MTRYKRNRRRNKKLFVFFTSVIMASILLAFMYRLLVTKGDTTGQLPFFIGGKNRISKTLHVQFDDYLTPSKRLNPYHKHLPVRGIFVNGPTAGSSAKLNDLIELTKQTDINAFVIDVKDDKGRITFDLDIPLVDQIDAEVNQFDAEVVMDQLYDNNIYPIARIVAFKDSLLSKKKPEYAIKNKDGTLWKYEENTWLNPYNRENWQYLLDIAKAAASKGFKEIQFDNTCFEATEHLEQADLGPDAENKTRAEVITEFVDYAVQELEPYPIEVSADVFGIIILSERDSQAIGQDYLNMASRLDVICPMIYPSHYDFGYFGIPKDKHSDLYPYETIVGTLNASNKKYTSHEEEIPLAVVRPWLQAFTASYLGQGNYQAYGSEEISSQIQAVYDTGLEEWLLWHSKSIYSQNDLVNINAIKQ